MSDEFWQWCVRWYLTVLLTHRKFQPFISVRLLTHYDINNHFWCMCVLYINTKDFVWRRVCTTARSFEHFCTSGTSATGLEELSCQSELIVQYNIGGNLGLNKCHFIPIRTGNCHHVLQQISINSTGSEMGNSARFIYLMVYLLYNKNSWYYYVFIPLRI